MATGRGGEDCAGRDATEAGHAGKEDHQHVDADLGCVDRGLRGAVGGLTRSLRRNGTEPMRETRERYR
jgi:hypothetical protein